LINLGIIYYFGEQVDKNINKAINYFERAVEMNHKGSENAINYLRIIFSSPMYLKDPKGLIYLEKSASLGNKEALKTLSIKYNEGFGVSKDFEKSFFYLFKYFSLNRDETSELLLKNMIQSRCVGWEKDHHFLWKNNVLDQKIVTILLISKNRFKFGIPLLNNLMANGISMLMIKYLCFMSINL
jgi:hypothetical protein